MHVMTEYVYILHTLKARVDRMWYNKTLLKTHSLILKVWSFCGKLEIWQKCIYVLACISSPPAITKFVYDVINVSWHRLWVKRHTYHETRFLFTDCVECPLKWRYLYQYSVIWAVVKIYYRPNRVVIRIFILVTAKLQRSVTFKIHHNS